MKDSLESGVKCKMDKEKIISKIFQDTNISRPRINLIFAKKCLEEYGKELSKELDNLIIDIEKHFEKVVNPKDNILSSLRKFKEKLLEK